MDESISVSLGVTNREGEEHTYRVEVWAVDPWEADRRQLVNKIDPFALPAGGGYWTRGGRFGGQIAMAAALEGIKVLDLSRILAGPWCTMTLADLGAEVWKIENPDGGDDTRT